MHTPLFWAGTTALLLSALCRGYPDAGDPPGEDSGGGIQVLSAETAPAASVPGGRGRDGTAPLPEGGTGDSGGGAPAPGPDADVPGAEPAAAPVYSSAGGNTAPPLEPSDPAESLAAAPELPAADVPGAESATAPVYSSASGNTAPPLEPPDPAESLAAAPELPAADVPGAEPAAPAESRRTLWENPPLTWGLCWAGAWEEGGNLTNRGDLKLHLTGPGLTLRGEVLDRRPGDFETLVHQAPWEAEDAVTNFLGGLYHDATGSRILYGPLEEWGLAARLRSPWSRGLPFPESRKASRADLRTAPSTREPELYVYLGTPFFGVPAPGKKPPDSGTAEGDGPAAAMVPGRENTGPGLRLRGFAAARLNPAALNPESGAPERADLPRPPLGEGTAITAALEGRLGRATALGLESFYTAGYIPARKASGWFSETPPLPLRDFRLHGLGLLLSFPYISLSGDFAWSRTLIQGRDIYANLGLRVGNKGTGTRPQSRPDGAWQLSLAADGAGQHYTGSDGLNPGAGFRTGGTLEWQQTRAGLFKVSTSLSGPGITLGGGEDPALNFTRSSSSLSYRPPAAALPLRLSRFSFSADRDAREPDAVRDSAGLGLSLAANPRGIAAALSSLNPSAGGPRGSAGGRVPATGGSALTLHVSGSLTGLPAGEGGAGEGKEPNRDISPWPLPRGPYLFESLKAGGELIWSRPMDLPPGGALDRFMNGSGGRGTVQIKAGLEYTLSAAAGGPLKETRTLNLQGVLRGRRSRFSVTLGYPDFPFSPREGGPAPAEAVNLTLSWNIEQQRGLP